MVFTVVVNGLANFSPTRSAVSWSLNMSRRKDLAHPKASAGLAFHVGGYLVTAG